MHYPLPLWLVQAQWDHKTPWPNNTEEGMQKSVQFFLLLMFAEVIHTNWNLAWCMHTFIPKWLISQLKPLNLILKIQRNAMQVLCTDFRAHSQPQTKPYSPLRLHRKNTQDLLNRFVTQALGFRKETAGELQLLFQSNSKHLQHPSKHWGALAVSHGQLLFGALPKANSGFHSEGHWCRKLEIHEPSWPPPRWARPRSLLAPWESGKWQSARPKCW